MSEEEMEQFNFELEEDIKNFIRNHIDPEFERIRKEHDIQHSIS